MKPARAVPGSASTLHITATASSGSKVSACSTQMIGAVASCTPRLIAAARPRVSCRTTSSPAASAMATEASALPPSTASTSAGGGSSAASERNSRGSPAASFSMGMTMATPVIAFGSLQQPGPARQAVRPVEVGELNRASVIGFAEVFYGSAHSRSIRLQARPNTEPQFCGLEIVNAVLTVGGVAFERRAHTNSHYARTPARARHGPSGGVGSCSKRSRTAFASQSRCWEYWSVSELTHRAPGSRRAAGSRKHSSGMPRICWRTIFICGKPHRYDKPLK